MNKLLLLKSWNDLQNHFEEMKNINMINLFQQESNRFQNFSLSFNEILVDFSKNKINKLTLELLLNLAKESNLKEAINSIFNGEIINFTEKRAVLHSALRNPQNIGLKDNEGLIFERIQSVLNHIEVFTKKVHNGEWLGFTGKKIKDIINIGIGGSDLGPMMVCEALKSFSNKEINIHFVSNIDGTHLSETLKKIDPETALFIIASKTFTTQETITNANSAKNWFLKKANNDFSAISKHFVALSTNKEEVIKFGIDPKNMFEFWDWVGGRYSLWSAIGLSISLYLGFTNFKELLLGANEIDQHFYQTPFESNIPIILGLIGIWYTNFFKYNSYGIIPYDQYLDKLPDFLQQLDMESNGKFVNSEGQKIEYPTGPVIWGRAGTNAQHSFFQLLHQGTQIIPCDFIGSIKSQNQIGDHHQILMSNFFAQTEALLKGKTKDEVLAELKESNLSDIEIEKLLPHKIFEGNRPTNTILLEEINPRNLGSLIAIYEHKVFVQGIIWKINSFDQWGVELGKQLAKKILPEIKSNEEIESHDDSTNNLLNYFKSKFLKTN